MNILILGGDGYLGWPTAMHFSELGHRVAVFDNGIKKILETECNVRPLFPIRHIRDRVDIWREEGMNSILDLPGDMRKPHEVFAAIETFKPEVIIHFAEQPSAPYSMKGRKEAEFTFMNNILGSNNLLWAMKELESTAHLVKTGSMGVYGTPNITIEEGTLLVTGRNGVSDLMPFPFQPGSFYHASKASDSINIRLACHTWGLRATDLHQGVVYGVETPQTKRHPGLMTNFHYDAIFGTVLNRFCMQAVLGEPITVYGTGTQTRCFLNLNDTLQCLTIAATQEIPQGTYRVFNQFTETFTIRHLAEIVRDAFYNWTGHKRTATIKHLPNPRKEREKHSYTVSNSGLRDLGMKPRLLSEELVTSMFDVLDAFKNGADRSLLLPGVKW